MGRRSRQAEELRRGAGVGSAGDGHERAWRSFVRNFVSLTLGFIELPAFVFLYPLRLGDPLATTFVIDVSGEHSHEA